MFEIKHTHQARTQGGGGGGGGALGVREKRNVQKRKEVPPGYVGKKECTFR